MSCCRKALIWGRTKTMGNNLKNKRMSARRVAGFMAALGVLVMSSGVALMVAATPASAAPGDKVVVCKYVSTPGGELDHIVIVSENTLPDAFADSFPFEWTDAHGQSGGSIAVRFATKGEQAHDINPSVCTQSGPTATTASVTFTDPTCAVAAGYATNGVGVTFDHPVAAPGATITVHATANAGYTLNGAAEFTHTFSAAPVCSTSVSPPTTPKTPKAPKHHATAVTPTVVHAGLAGTTVQDVRGEQGLALMVAGMVMLAGAGGLRLRSGRASRI
jgi:hypothetical protein